MVSAMTEHPIHIQPIDENHAAPTHADDPVAREPGAAGFLRIPGGGRDEIQIPRELLDGAPALQWALRNVERARTVLRLHCLILEDVLHTHGIGE